MLMKNMTIRKCHVTDQVTEMALINILIIAARDELLFLSRYQSHDTFKLSYLASAFIFDYN